MDQRAFSALVRTRRIVRNYTEEPVDDAAVTRILDLARRGPSAGFSQGVSFIVIKDKDLRSRIAELANESTYVEKGLDPWISRAPIHVVVCTSEETYRTRYRESDKSPDGTETEWPVPYWWVDAGAAMMLLLLATASEGLGGGFLGAHAVNDLAKTLELPDHVEAIGIVTIGHINTTQRSQPRNRARKSWANVVRKETWNG